jgi:hypothetical protein
LSVSCGLSDVPLRCCNAAGVPRCPLSRSTTFASRPKSSSPREEDVVPVSRRPHPLADRQTRRTAVCIASVPRDERRGLHDLADTRSNVLSLPLINSTPNSSHIRRAPALAESDFVPSSSIALHPTPHP